MTPLPSLDKIKEWLDYDPETGAFTWRTTHNGVLAGQRAGYVSTGGYRRIKFKGRLLSAHRLAWLYVHGMDPATGIDHINGDTGDNRIANLRLATTRQNSFNSKRSKSNTSGFKGVSLHRGKWRARIKLNGKTINLGFFATPEAAHSAYAAKATVLFGEFARLR